MLEREVIQSRGFRNIIENGAVVGFQIPVRSTYYRGIWLSQLRPGDVTVDGEVFAKDSVIWEIGGVEYTTDEMLTLGKVHWELMKPAYLKIKKAGGLSQGYHDVSVTFGNSASYMPPSFDDLETGVGFGPSTHSRKLLIV